MYIISYLTSVIGEITPPEELDRFGDVERGGIGNLLNLFLGLMVVGAGIYALFNFVMAGYGYLSAGNDPKKLTAASAKIWQSVLGLTLAAGALVLAAVFGLLIFGSADAIINPTIPTPP